MFRHVELGTTSSSLHTNEHERYSPDNKSSEKATDGEAVRCHRALAVTCLDHRSTGAPTTGIGRYC